MKNIVIIGAGELGKQIVWLIEDINKEVPTYLILGFLDDDYEKKGMEFYGYKVLGRVALLGQLSEKMPLSAVIAIQDGSARKQIVQENASFENWESIIHPTSVIASTSTIGVGSVFFPQVTVSVDSKLGVFGLYNIHSTISNDCFIGNYTSLMSGVIISEHSNIGDECLLGAGSCVYPYITVGNKSKVPVGAIVQKDCK